MNNLHVRKGDNVKVLTGKDKGKTGKILATDPKTQMVLVEGVNIATHHIKARSATEQGGRKKVEAPISASNVQIICPSCGQSVRARHQEVDGKNVRICAKCGASLDIDAKTEKANKKAKDKADKKAKKAASKDEDQAEGKAKKPAAKKTKKAETQEVPVDNNSDGKTE
ncbi:MAG: 50S ribosomal protein L24 [Clostridiales bacterium]|nr:50S ribosomal protein L24 [Clostridiales bacterium]